MPHDDLILPFSIEGMDVRGRMVRIGPVLDEILSAHNYPEPVARLLGDAIALVALLGGSLKFGGIFTLQAQGKGPVSLIAADLEVREGQPDKLRGFAQFDAEAVAALGEQPAFEALVGQKGYFALTIDPDGDMDRYQGVVELAGEGLADCASRYFEQSEQLPTSLCLATTQVMGQGEGWRTGAVMVQHLAKPGVQLSDEERDGWRRAEALLQTATAAELTDPTLKSEELLFRLFNEDGVRVFDAVSVEKGCRCSEQKIRDTLAQFGEEDRAHMVGDDGVIEVVCEFCSTAFRFAPDGKTRV